MDYTDVVAVLRQIPMFAALDTATQKLLAISSNYLIIHAGETVFTRGQPSDNVFLIGEGEVDVIGEVGGHEVPLARLGRNQLVGEMGVLRAAPRSATARAVTEVKLLCFDAEIFLRLVAGNPTAATAVMRDLSDKLAMATAKLEQLTGAVGGPSTAGDGI